ncbi:tail fiber protein [Paenibacillus glacialis]|uniref:DUF1565 domain-containing protein n=1 Tax=Paenibacillus glacialis TaxID=494026 RepID=A0A168D4J9_9BACL|nr:phage tail protein [Paenibacillus glacialis]OAB33861.1 hypothetical protein PGLA_23345 [Paenibacillus glacialis]
MPSNTPNLGLLKKDPVIDSNDTFNIKTMLNDNWDKIDGAIGELREDVQDIVIPDASLTVKGITQLNSAVNSASETEAATPKALKTVNDSLTTHKAETVKQTTVDIIFYVATTGNDTTGDGTSGNPFKTIQFAINKLPKFIANRIIINVIAGNYAEDISFVGFSGRSGLELNGPNCKINSLNIYDNSITISVTSFEVISSVDGMPAFVYMNSKRINLVSLKMVSISPYGVLVNSSNAVQISNCQISNKTTSAISIQYLSVCFSEENSGTGNSIALQCTTASTIGKSGSQPSGTTAEEVAWGGAQ